MRVFLPAVALSPLLQPKYRWRSMLLKSGLISQVPGVRHGFSTRLGGLTPGPTGTWDFTPTALGAGENRRRFALCLDLPSADAVCVVKQVHGDTLVWAPDAAGVEADAVATDSNQHAVAVATADCAPVLFCSPDGKLVAAAHAGWRGAVGGILRSTVDALVQRGARAETLLAAIGPCIGPDAFEVGPEVVQAASAALGTPAPARAGAADRHYLDLAQLVRQLLVQLGLSEDNIDSLAQCTHSNVAMFHSYRRDGAGKGRMMSGIRRGLV